MLTIHNEITRKASRHSGFRAQLLDDPQQLLRAEYGVEIPAGMALRSTELDNLHFDLSELESTRLSDGDVEVMAAFAADNVNVATTTGNCVTFWTQGTNCG